jgi:hypothetical protein
VVLALGEPQGALEMATRTWRYSVDSTMLDEALRQPGQQPRLTRLTEQRFPVASS